MSTHLSICNRIEFMKSRIIVHNLDTCLEKLETPEDSHKQQKRIYHVHDYKEVTTSALIARPTHETTVVLDGVIQY